MIYIGNTITNCDISGSYSLQKTFSVELLHISNSRKNKVKKYTFKIMFLKTINKIVIYIFQSFQPVVTLSPELTSSLVLQVKNVDSTVEAGAQFQQMVNIECTTGKKFREFEFRISRVFFYYINYISRGDKKTREIKEFLLVLKY